MWFDRSILVDGPVTSLDISDVLLTEMIQRLHVGQIRLKLFDDGNYVNEVTNCHIGILTICPVSPLRTDSIDLKTSDILLGMR